MKRHMHWWLTVLFVLALVYDLAIWGAAARLPDVGPKLQVSAHRSALFATLYMNAGDALLAAVPVLGDWATQYVSAAWSPWFERIRQDPYVAMDLILSESATARQSTIRILYYAAPVLGLVALVLWSRRPKKISLGRR